MHIEDVNGDGKFDILMGDNGVVEDGDVRGDLTQEERNAYDKLLEERVVVSARFAEARKVWDRDYEKALKEAGELTEKEGVLLYRKLVRNRMAENEEYQRLKEIAAERNQYQQPYVRRGFVWLFTQR